MFKRLLLPSPLSIFTVLLFVAVMHLHGPLTRLSEARVIYQRNLDLVTAAIPASALKFPVIKAPYPKRKPPIPRGLK